MQRYQSHKVVEAMRIDQMFVDPTSDTVELTSMNNGWKVETVPVLRDWIEKKIPGEDIAEKLSKVVGGYLVKYTDGYLSWSPAKAFEEGYTLLKGESLPQNESNQSKDQTHG